MLLIAARPLMVASSRFSGTPVRPVVTADGSQYLTGAVLHAASAATGFAEDASRSVDVPRLADRSTEDDDGVDDGHGDADECRWSRADMEPDEDGGELCELLVEVANAHQPSEGSDAGLAVNRRAFRDKVLRQSEEAFSFLAGCVAAKCVAVDPTLGCRTSNPDAGSRAAAVPASWTRALSYGNLTVPTEQWLDDCRQLEVAFCAVMGKSFYRGSGIKKTSSKPSQEKTHSSARCSHPRLHQH